MTSPDPPNSDMENPAVPPLVLDPDKYRHHLADYDISVEEQQEFLAVIWCIVCTCVDIGVGLDSVQLLPQEKTATKTDLSGDDSVNVVKMEATHKRFNRNASAHAIKEDQHDEGSA